MAEVELVGGKLALVSVPLIYFISSKEYVNKLEQCSQRFFHRGEIHNIDNSFFNLQYKSYVNYSKRVEK